MKVKNIMFNGVMASILMVGGAYAADGSVSDDALATAGFVRGAYNDLKENLDNKVAIAQGPANATQILVTDTDGNVAMAQNISMSNVDGLNTALSGKASATDLANLTAKVGDSENGLVQQVAANTSALSSKVTANAAITGGTGTKITYDSKGLVTGSSALVAADIPTIGQNQVDGLVGALAGKQAQLTDANQGNNVTITTDAQGKVTISATDTTYTAGNGIGISGTTVSASAKQNGGIIVDANGIGANVDNVSIGLTSDGKIKLNYSITPNVFSL